MQRGLGQLDCTHIVLRDTDRTLAFLQHIRIGATILDNAVAVFACNRSNHAILIDEASEKHFRDHFDNPGPTNSANSDTRTLVGEIRILGPGFASNDSKIWFQCLRINTDALSFMVERSEDALPKVTGDGYACVIVA